MKNKSISKDSVIGAADFMSYFKIPCSYDKKLVTYILGNGKDKKANEELAKLIVYELNEAYESQCFPELHDELLKPALNELSKQIRGGSF